MRGLRQALLDPACHHVGGMLPLPCNAMIGRSGLVCPGGRAIAKLVATPPRAAETNEPVTYVGACRRGSSGAAVPAGTGTVIDTGGGTPAGSAGTPPRPRRADTKAQNRATVQFGHAGHHAIGGWSRFPDFPE